MEMAELTATFPNNSVHNNKFPLFLNGRILLAYFFSFGLPKEIRLLFFFTRF
jgi:hypothetical protein